MGAGGVSGERSGARRAHARRPARTPRPSSTKAWPLFWGAAKAARRAHRRRPALLHRQHRGGKGSAGAQPLLAHRQPPAQRGVGGGGSEAGLSLFLSFCVSLFVWGWVFVRPAAEGGTAARRLRAKVRRRSVHITARHSAARAPVSPLVHQSQRSIAVQQRGGARLQALLCAVGPAGRGWTVGGELGGGRGEGSGWQASLDGREGRGKKVRQSDRA